MNDQLFTVDHFFVKLFHVAENLKTETGRIEGLKRVNIMKNYLIDLNNEI